MGSDDAAVAHHHDPRTDDAQRRRVVCRHDERGPDLVQSPQGGDDEAGGLRRESRERLVDEREPRLRRGDAGEREQPLLGRLQRGAGAVPLRRKTGDGEAERDRVARPARAESPSDRRRDDGIVDHGAVEKRRRLKTAGDAGARDPVGSPAGDVFTAKRDAAPLRAEEARDDVQQRRLPAAPRAERPAGGDADRELADRPRPLGADPYAVEPQQRSGAVARVLHASSHGTMGRERPGRGSPVRSAGRGFQLKAGPNRCCGSRRPAATSTPAKTSSWTAAGISKNCAAPAPAYAAAAGPATVAAPPISAAAGANSDACHESISGDACPDSCAASAPAMPAIVPAAMKAKRRRRGASKPSASASRSPPAAARSATPVRDRTRAATTRTPEANAAAASQAAARSSFGNVGSGIAVSVSPLPRSTGTVHIVARLRAASTVASVTTATNAGARRRVNRPCRPPKHPPAIAAAAVRTTGTHPPRSPP